MKLRNLTTGIFLACSALGQHTVAAAPPAANDATDRQSAPEKHPEAYQRFKAILEEQTRKNIYDPCPAMHEVLQATDDEFAADSWMQKAANEGCAAALYFVGVKELNIVPANAKQHPKIRSAVIYLKKASDKKYSPAMVDFSACLRCGVGTIKNEVLADKLLMEACHSNLIEPRYSWLLQTDRISKYEDLQREEVKSEIKRGNHVVLYHLSAKAPDTFKKVNVLTEAARMGSGKAMYELSVIISHVNIHASYHYLKMAAAYHEGRAIQKMGEYLISARKEIADQLGIQKDEKAGVYLLKLATMLGNNNARLYMAKLYTEGLCGMPHNPERAYRHLLHGTAAFPSADLLAAQGYMLVTGTGVEQNSAEGMALLDASVKAAVKAKNPHPIILRAYVYHKGYGNADESLGREAVYILKDMAVRGVKECFIYLALIYKTGGNGVEKNEKEALYYLDHAKRVMGDYAEQLYNAHLEKYGEWHLMPIDIVL